MRFPISNQLFINKAHKKRSRRAAERRRKTFSADDVSYVLKFVIRRLKILTRIKETSLFFSFLLLQSPLERARDFWLSAEQTLNLFHHAYLDFNFNSFFFVAVVWDTIAESPLITFLSQDERQAIRGDDVQQVFSTSADRSVGFCCCSCRGKEKPLHIHEIVKWRRNRSYKLTIFVCSHSLMATMMKPLVTQRHESAWTRREKIIHRNRIHLDQFLSFS